MPDRVLVTTPYLRMIDREGWFFVERPNASAVVIIVARTDDDRLIFVEQHRAPVARNVIEWPAGLVGDEPGRADEELTAAARRELVEETGYDAGSIEPLGTCASSPGMTSEAATFFLATNLRKVGTGGGVGDERIAVHEVPFAGVRAWLRERERAGAIIAAKVYSGLYLAQDRWER